ncbi:hypothetical protein EPO15_08105 [bacterium]|nr:MAG: hypothetical protein EPO15_08105 [bacterium]
MRRALLVLLAGLAAACSRRHPCDKVAQDYDKLPRLAPVSKAAPVTLRVLYLEDERLPTLTAEGRAELYRRVEALTKRWYGYTLRLSEVGARPLRIEFAGERMPFASPDQAACLAASRLDLETKAGKEGLLYLVGREYAVRGREVFERLFPETKGMDPYPARAAAAAKVRSVNAWLAGLETKAGALVRSEEDRRLTSTLHWMVYIREQTDADFVLTNTAMIEPDNDMPVYVLARGGLTTGFVDNNPKAPYGAAGVVTLLPFLGGERLFDPSAKPTTASENVDAAATMWLHELGHFLNRYGEMYGETGCVHVASESLAYFKWHRAIRKADNKCSAPPAAVSKF